MQINYLRPKTRPKTEQQLKPFILKNTCKMKTWKKIVSVFGFGVFYVFEYLPEDLHMIGEMLEYLFVNL